MFCPRCGSNQSDELKFCKACGANLYAVRQVVDTRVTNQKFDWSKTWVADMFISGEEAVKRQAEIERHLGITPATRRYQEIKAGVITSSVGLAVAVFLSIFMDGIIRSGRVSTAAAEILSHLWIVGVIPLFVGLALIINGYFVSRRIVDLWKQDQLGSGVADREPEPHLLTSPDTSEFVSSSFSVTEGTTKHLSEK
jgi:hypothetical protein